MAQYEITLKDYWRILRRRKAVVAAAVVMMGTGSFILDYFWQPEPVFRATTKVQINSQQSLTGIYLEAISYNSADEIETQEAVITSYPVMLRTAAALGALATARDADDTTRIVLDLQERVNTDPEGYTNIIAIEVTDSNPRQVKELANTLAREYSEFDKELRNQKTSRRKHFVAREREEARRQLEAAEDAVRRYREENDLISLEAQTSVMLGQITQVEAQIQARRQDMAALEAMVKEMESRAGLSEQTLQGASRERVGEAFVILGQQFNALRLERDGLLVKFTEAHPGVRQIQVKLDQLAREMLSELRQRRRVLDGDIKALESRLGTLRAEYSLLPSRGLELGRLQREVTLRQRIVTVLEEEYQTAVIHAADSVVAVTVLQKAIAPKEPANASQPLKRAFLGMALGLIVGIVFAVLIETMDTSIGTIEDVEEYTETKVVGIVPFINVDEVGASLKRRGVDISDEAALRRKAQLVAYFDPLSVLAETYRTLRTNIEFVTVEKGARSLMITSSMLREGKSTTIANLAMTMAQLGKRTLLVDCDLRKPTVARLFGLDKEPGMTEVIVGNHPWTEVVRTVTDIVTGGMGMEDILQTQGISNLHIITSGAIPPNPAELLNSHRMDEFIAQVEEAYDVVLFDSPPVLHVTDAAILGKKVDGAIVVYKAGDIARTSLKQSTNLLRSVEVEMLGVVINGISKDVSTQFHDLGYSSYYAYGHEGVPIQRSMLDRTRDGVTGVLQRVKRQKDRWDDRMGPGDDEEGEDGQWQLQEKPAGSSKAAWILLGAVGLGLFWQSGVPQRHLGLMPLIEARPRSVPVPTAPLGARANVEAVKLAGSDTGHKERVDAVEAHIPALPLATARLAAAPAVELAADEGVSPAQPRPLALRIASYPKGSPWARPALDRLRGVGLQAFLQPVAVNGDSMQRLFAGSFARWDEAVAAGRQLRREGTAEEFIVVRLPFAIELDADAPVDEAGQALLYIQDVEGGQPRRLAGGFAEFGEAVRFLERQPLNRGRIAMR